jgi:hypothetical protein
MHATHDQAAATVPCLPASGACGIAGSCLARVGRESREPVNLLLIRGPQCTGCCECSGSESCQNNRVHRTYCLAWLLHFCCSSGACRLESAVAAPASSQRVPAHPSRMMTSVHAPWLMELSASASPGRCVYTTTVYYVCHLRGCQRNKVTPCVLQLGYPWTFLNS